MPSAAGALPNGCSTSASGWWRLALFCRRLPCRLSRWAGCNLLTAYAYPPTRCPTPAAIRAPTRLRCNMARGQRGFWRWRCLLFCWCEPVFHFQAASGVGCVALPRTRFARLHHNCCFVCVNPFSVSGCLWSMGCGFTTHIVCPITFQLLFCLREPVSVFRLP